MSFIDFILNIAGLLLWLNWRAIHLTPIGRPGSSLVATLRNANPPQSRWLYLLALAGLLLFRALIYWQLAPALPWTPRISLGLASITFRNNLPMFFAYMSLFSFISFTIALLVFYLFLVAFSCLNSNLPENDPYHRFVQLHLSFVERLPKAIKFFLPWIISIGLWYLTALMLQHFNMMSSTTPIHLAGQGALLGIELYSLLIYLAVAVLCLDLINSYVYLGNFLFLDFIHGSADNLLRPLRKRWLPLTIGKLDLAPPIAITLLIEGPTFLSWIATRYGWSLHALFQKVSY